jgi:hypothetical protein
VGVPIGQSLFSGVVGGLVAAVVAWRIGGDVLTWLTVGFVGALAVCWLASLGLARALVWQIERITGSDLDRDGRQGRPEPATHVMIENAERARAEAGKIERVNGQRARTAELLSFVTRCATVGCSEGKQGIKPSPSERAKYAALRDTLIQLGIGAWRDPERPKLGWELVLTPEQAAPIIARHVRELRDAT